MRVLSVRALVIVMMGALTLAACSGGGSLPRQIPNGQSQPAPAAPGPSSEISFSSSGGTYALPLPQGYSGTISIAPNHAPPGATMRVSVRGAAFVDVAGAATLSSRTVDPFPILINIQLPFTITLPVPAFSITFPRGWRISPGTFDVSLFDPTQPISPPTNPTLLGTAVVSGRTLTFTPPPGETVTFVAGVPYTLTISRNVSSNYPGGANSVVLPVQSNTDQTLASVGQLGAGVAYTASTNSGFLQWQTINGAPSGISPLIYNGQPVESLVVSATQALTLSSVTVEASFGTSTSASARLAAAFSRLTTTGVPPGTFVPDANPKVFGPFPATVTGGVARFTVTPDDPHAPLALGGSKAWNISLVTVTACVPVDAHMTCDTPASSNVATSVPTNTQFDLLVSDASGLLRGPYSVSVTPPCSVHGINQNDNNGDNPPGYNDNPTGPNAEFEVRSGSSSGTCTITVSFNNSPVAQTSVGVGTTGLSTRVRPFTLRPPVNGPRGFAVGGTIP